MTIDLEARRAELVDLRTRLLTAAEDLANGEGIGEINVAAGDQHLADHAADMFDREIDESLEENAAEIVREIDAALTRLDAGTYGVCEVCGEAIPEERLAAVPYATLCVADKRAQERE